MESHRVHRIEIIWCQAFRGDHRGPPLIAHRGQAHDMKNLEWHVCLKNRVGTMILENIVAQLREPLFLVRAGTCRAL